MSRPLVSVVIPTYNRSGYVVEAVDSVLRQTYPSYEVIVVDDGSTDDTHEALEPYMGRIRYVRQENLGEGAARNLGVSRARGEYVAFLDSDDMWEPEFLAATMEAFKKFPEAEMVTTNFKVINAEGKTVAAEIGKRSPNSFFTTAGLLDEDWRTIGMPVARRESLVSVGEFEGWKVGADMNMWLRFSLRFPIAHVPRCLQVHRYHEGSSAGDWEAFLERDISGLRKFIEEHALPLFGKNHLFRRALASIRLGRRLLSCFHPPCLRRMNRQVGYLYHFQAYQRMLANRHREARGCLTRAIRYRPLYLKNYAYLLFTCLPSSAYAVARRLKRTLCS
jgi:glycosyltransferase involved in cell wall biosynthesis